MIPVIQAAFVHFKNVFIHKWKRKVFALLLSVFFWFIVNHSLTTTRTIMNVPIKVINLPPTHTIEGIQASGRLSKKINLTLVGNKAVLDPLEASDLEVILDATNRQESWPVFVSKKMIHCNNPDVDINQSVSKIHHPSLNLHLSKLVTEKITVHICSPTGEAPRGYHFLDVWPYSLELTVTGPVEALKKARHREIKLNLSLSDVTKKQLDLLSKGHEKGRCDVISFPIPEAWKTLNIPYISENPIFINDPQAKLLRFDFIRYEYLPLEAKIPVQFFFRTSTLGLYSPKEVLVDLKEPFHEKDGLYFIEANLYATGVDNTFINLVKDHIQISVDVNAESRLPLNWSLQIINSQKLEHEYVEKLLSSIDDENFRSLHFNQRQEYLRNRFRSYTQRMRLFNSGGSKLNLQFRMENFKIHASVGPNKHINQYMTSWEDDE